MIAFGTYIIPNNFLMGLTQVKESNLTGKTQVVHSHISASASTYDNFLQAVSSVPFVEPVRVEAGRIHADERQMEVGKPYSAQYGKGAFVVIKDSKDRIHVYKLP